MGSIDLEDDMLPSKKSVAETNTALMLGVDNMIKKSVAHSKKTKAIKQRIKELEKQIELEE